MHGNRSWHGMAFTCISSGVSLNEWDSAKVDVEWPEICRYNLRLTKYKPVSESYYM